MGRYRHVETAREKRSLEARIWWTFFGISLLVLCYTVFHQVKEYRLVHYGNSFEAEYQVYQGRELATYYDENNHYYHYDISGMDAIHGENTVTMYYTDDMYRAQPHMHPRMWIFPYALFGVMFLVCSLRLRKIYSKKNLSLYETHPD